MASNRAVHTIDPWPYNSQKTQIDIDGKRVQTAVRRYETNAKAKTPDNGREPNGR
jgi:Arc/MetJ family transcription regulator